MIPSLSIDFDVIKALRPTPQLPESEKKKDIERAFKKMTAEKKNDLMRKLAELDAEDANDDESTPPSPTPV
jgi:hypothetical protein